MRLRRFRPVESTWAHEFGRRVALMVNATRQRGASMAVDKPDFSGDVKQAKVYHWRTNPRGQEDSKMILTDAAITRALNQTVQQIREGDLEQAQAGLAVLEFQRLL